MNSEQLQALLILETGCSNVDAFQAIFDTMNQRAYNSLWSVAVEMQLRNLSYPTLMVETEWFRDGDGGESVMPTFLCGPEKSYDLDTY